MSWASAHADRLCCDKPNLTFELKGKMEMNKLEEKAEKRTKNAKRHDRAIETQKVLETFMKS